MTTVLGADIGNGYCYISILDENKRVMSLMPDKFANIGMPSTVYINDDGDICIVNTEKIRAMQYRHPERVVHAVKTRLHESSITIPNGAAPISVSPADIYAEIVKEAVSNANYVLRQNHMKPVYQISLAYPAAYHDDSDLIERLRKAVERVELDGQHLTVVGMLPEPTAIALDYLWFMQHESDHAEIGSNRTVLVYDLGHGSFDAALVTTKDVQREGDVPYDVLRKNGIEELGGYYFDNDLTELLREKMRAQGYSVDNEQILRETAVRIKENLSLHPEVTELISTGGEIIELTVTRQEFEELLMPRLADSFSVVESMLQYAESENTVPDEIIISGGSANIPMIGRCLEELFPAYRGRVILHKPHAAVSAGAARYADGIAALNETSHSNAETETPTSSGSGNTILQQRTSYPYGVRLPSLQQMNGDVRFIVPADAVLPFVSEEVTMIPASDRLRVRLVRPTLPELKEEMDGFYHLMDLIFDGVEAGKPCSIGLEITEQYGIIAFCRKPDGAILRKGSYNTEYR